MVKRAHNIFVTGGNGFVGSHVISDLVKKGSRVVTPLRTQDPFSYFHSEKLHEKVIQHPLSILNVSDCLSLLSSYNIDYVIHLAAQPLVETAYINPHETIQTNIMGTTGILDAVRLYGKCKGIIVASSDKSYGEVKDKQYVESDPLHGRGPYDVSKSAADLVAQMYIQTYHLPIVITRFGNIYGAGDINFSRIIPGIMKAIYFDEVLQLRSDGTFVRDYVHVNDVSHAYSLILKHFDTVSGESFNISSEDSFSVLSLIAFIEDILGKKIKKKILNSQKGEIPYQKLNDTKFRKMTSFSNEHSIKNSITSVYDWYQKLFKKYPHAV